MSFDALWRPSATRTSREPKDEKAFRHRLGKKKKKNCMTNCMHVAFIRVRFFMRHPEKVSLLSRSLKLQFGFAAGNKSPPFRPKGGKKTWRGWKRMLVSPHPPTHPRKKPWRKHSSHDSRLSFHVNRLITAQHQSVSGTLAAEARLGYSQLVASSRVGDGSWKSLMIQLPVTFTQWHPCTRRRETAHPSHRGLETQLNHLTYKRRVNGGMMGLQQGRKNKNTELHSYQRLHTFPGAINFVFVDTRDKLYFNCRWTDPLIKVEHFKFRPLKLSQLTDKKAALSSCRPVRIKRTFFF